MEIPVELFLGGIAVSIALAIFGFIRQPQIPAMLVFGGMFILTFAIATDTIILDSFAIPSGDTRVYSYNVESFTGAADICGGATCFNVRGEYLLSSSSMLFGDTIDCIDIPLRKIGAPTGTATIGIYDHAQATDNPILKTFGTIDVSTLDVNIWIYYTFCLTNDTYTMGDQDVIGVRYDGGDMSNAVRVAVTTGDIFDSSQTEHTRQDAALNTWSNFAAVDTTMRTYLSADNVITQTNAPYQFTELPKTLFALIGVICMLCGGLMVFKD